MAGGSKSKSQSTQESNSGSAQAWANPYAVSGVNEITGVYQANKPNLEAQVAKANELSGQLTGAYGQAGRDYGVALGDTRAIAGAPNAGRGYYGDVLGGKYLTGNPFLDAIVSQVSGDVTDNVNSQFTEAGRYGSGAHTGVMTKELAEAANALRYSDYNSQMGRMDTAAAGSVQDQLARQQLAQQQQQQASTREAQLAGLSIGQQQQAAQLPYTGASTLAQALAALFSGGSSSGQSTAESKEKGSLLAGIGAMLGGLSPA